MLFDHSATHDKLEARLDHGVVLDGLKLSRDVQPSRAEGSIPMFVLSPTKLHILVADEAMSPDPWRRGIRLVSPKR